MQNKYLFSRRKLSFRRFRKNDVRLQAAWLKGFDDLSLGEGRSLRQGLLYPGFLFGGLLYGGLFNQGSLDEHSRSRSSVRLDNWAMTWEGRPVGFISVLRTRLSGVQHRQMALIASPFLRQRAILLSRAWSAASLFVFQQYGLDPIEVSINKDDVFDGEALERAGYRFVEEGESETVRTLSFRCRWGDLRGVL